MEMSAQFTVRQDSYCDRIAVTICYSNSKHTYIYKFCHWLHFFKDVFCASDWFWAFLQEVADPEKKIIGLASQTGTSVWNQKASISVHGQATLITLYNVKNNEANISIFQTKSQNTEQIFMKPLLISLQGYL